MANAADLGSAGVNLEGSSPFTPTNPATLTATTLPHVE